MCVAGRPRRVCGAVHDVVVDQRAGVHELQRGDRPRAPRRRPRAVPCRGRRASPSRRRPGAAACRPRRARRPRRRRGPGSGSIAARVARCRSRNSVSASLTRRGAGRGRRRRGRASGYAVRRGHALVRSGVRVMVQCQTSASWSPVARQQVTGRVRRLVRRRAAPMRSAEVARRSPVPSGAVTRPCVSCSPRSGRRGRSSSSRRRPPRASAAVDGAARARAAAALVRVGDLRRRRVAPARAPSR